MPPYRDAPDPYWKAKLPGGEWQRYGLDGNELDANEAHPGNPQIVPRDLGVPGDPTGEVGISPFWEGAAAVSPMGAAFFFGVGALLYSPPAY